MKTLATNVLALLALAPMSAALRAADGEPARPNIIFIMSDDHCAQAISAYGSVVNETPNIDRLANEGVRFDNCFVTNAICGPSRAVILTGLHSHLNGKTTNGSPAFDGSQMTFPKVLQQAGYQTAMIGKWHLRSTPTGFDYHDVLIGQGPYYNPPMMLNGEKVNRTGYTTDIITDLAIDWLENGRNADKPFMMMMHHKAPHRNWQPGPEHLHDYEGVDIPAPPTLFDDWSGRGSASAAQEMTIARHLSEHDLKLAPQRGFTEEQQAAWDAAYGPRNEAFRAANLTGDDLVKWKYQRYVKDYLRCVASVDDSVGRVLDFLDASGLAENTIVVYTSDQGWFLGEHGWYDKRWMYEESMRMPLLVRWPGQAEAGATDDHLVQNLDFAPTFLAAAGAEIPAAMQGESMLPLLAGRNAPWRDSVYYHYYEFPAVHSVARHDGVRTDRYKLIDFYQLGEWELYDLTSDPDEMKSVAGDSRYAEIEAELRGQLEELRRTYRVPAEHGRAGTPDQ
ncbi:MAG: sulfatase family protein [Planctomycetota bacterium]|jgi:arylsulfatase A-like enzyme